MGIQVREEERTGEMRVGDEGGGFRDRFVGGLMRQAVALL